MFFRSWRARLCGIVLILVGCGFLAVSWIDQNAASQETTTTGVITKVYYGKSTSYDYIFQVNGVSIKDDAGSCHTPLSPQGCVSGAPVLVYYDPKHLSMSMLQEIGSAAREKLFFGLWMTGFGLFLVALYLILKKNDGEGEDSEEEHESDRNDESEVLHVVPGK
jgi:hypothetical protein